MIRIKNNLPARLPSEYQEVEYLESTGDGQNNGQYIDTGYCPYKTMTETVFQKNNDRSTLHTFIIGVYNSNNNRYYAGEYYNTTNAYRVQDRGATKITLGTHDQKIHTIIYNDNNNAVLFDGVNKGTVSDLTTQSTRPIFFFGFNGSTGLEQSFAGRIYSVKITDKTTNTLVRDFVPCYRKSDNEPGMYDLANNVFYTNAGSGTFLIGNEVGKRDININPAIFNLPMARGYINGKLFYGEEPKQGRFVCVGEKGNSYYSLDGETWASMNGLAGTSTSVNACVTYGNGMFVTINSAKKTYFSTDGETWVETNGVASNTINGVAYGNGRFVCVGLDGKSYYSTDGKTWTAMSGLPSGYNFRAVTYGNDRFVCVGNSGKSYYSTNGTSWTAMSGLANSAYWGVAYGNGVYVAVGASNPYYSTDGINWAIGNGGQSVYADLGVCFGNGRFVCVSENGYSHYSTDGINWTAMTGLGSTTTINGVTYGNDRFVCVGASGKSYYSTNGTSWVAMTGLASAAYNGVCYG